MYGAIIGDLAGSIYEYSQIKGINKVNCSEIIPEKAFFSDDTILTIAIADAINNDGDYGEYLKKYGKEFLEYKPDFSPYFKTSFSPGFIKWVKGNYEGKSIGNGAMMRISPVGFYYNSEDEVLENAILATKPSHNSKEAMYSSSLVALIIYYAKNGMGKDKIMKRLNIKLTEPKIEKFNSTCSETNDVCLYALFTSNSFEESIKKVLKYGGDTDTNACIVGSMAEAMYGIDDELIKKAKAKIPNEFIEVIDKFEMKRSKNRQNDEMLEENERE